jgi:hypothetical protein
MSDYDRMRQSDYLDEEGYRPEDYIERPVQTEKEKYFEYYDDIKQTPKDDW